MLWLRGGVNDVHHSQRLDVGLPTFAPSRAPVLGAPCWGENGWVVLLEVVVVLALVGLGLYTILRALTSHGSTATTSGPGQWRVTHYDVKGVTRVVVQKLSPGGANILNEHVVATIDTGDPEYDAKFLSATATARERRAMFETEEG
jgi:hypothetical protein